MSGALRELFVFLGLETDTKDFKAAEKAIEGVVKSAKAAVVAVGALTAAATAAAVRFAHAGDQAAKTGKRLGITAEEVQELAFAADRSGVPFEKLVGGLRNLGRQQAEAAKGSKEVGGAFRALGVRVTDGNGRLRPTVEVMEDVADALGKIPDAGRRTALAMKVAGEGGAALIPLLLEGAAGIRALREEARELGGVLTEEMTKEAEALNDALGDLRFAADGLVKSFGFRVSPIYRRLIKQTLDWLKANRDLVKRGLNQLAAVFGVVVHAAERVFTWFWRIAGVVKKLTVDLIGFRATVALLGVGLTFLAGAQIGMAAKALLTLARAMNLASLAGLKAAAVYGVWAIALVALALVIEDFASAVRGEGSVIQDFIDVFLLAENPEGSWIVEALRFAASAMKLLVEMTRAFVDLFSDDAGELGRARQFWLGFWDPIFVFWKKQFRDFWDWPYFKMLRQLTRFDVIGAAKSAGFDLGPVGRLHEAIQGDSLIQIIDKELAGARANAAKAPGFSTPVQAVAGGAGTVTLNAPVTVNAAPGMDESTLANEVGKQLDQRFRMAWREID